MKEENDDGLTGFTYLCTNRIHPRNVLVLPQPLTGPTRRCTDRRRAIRGWRISYSVH